MRIVCPGCTATYDVPERLAGSGKRLRCARCAHEWIPQEMAASAADPAPPSEPVAPPPPPPPPPAPPAAPPPRQPDPAPPPALHAEPKPKVSAQARRSVRLAVGLALALSVLALAGLLAAGLWWRQAVMQLFPPSRLLFGWLGLG